MQYNVIKVLGIYDKSKNGQMFVTKKGDPYRKASVHFAEDPQKIVNVFVWGNETCEVGSEYEGVIESREYEGKTYYSFNGNQKQDKYMAEIAALKFSLASAHQKIDEVVEYLKKKPWTAPITPSVASPVPPIVKTAQVETAVVGEGINPEYIPF